MLLKTQTGSNRVEQLLNPICSHVNKQANTKQRRVPSWCGLKAQNEDTVVQGPRPATARRVRRGREGHRKWASSGIKAHVGGWGRRVWACKAGRGHSPAHVTSWFRRWALPGYLGRSFCFVHNSVVWRGGWTLGSQTEAPACVNSKWHGLGPFQCTWCVKRMQLWFGSQNLSSSGPWTHHFF